MPMTQETLNDLINTRIAVQGAQGPQITLPQPLLEILTGTVATHCQNKISSSPSWVHSYNQTTQPKCTLEDILQGQLKYSSIFKDTNNTHECHHPKKQMNWFTNQAEVQLFPLSNRVSHSKTKQIGLFQRKSPKRRRNRVPNCTRPQRDLRLLFGACLLPNIDSLFQLPSAGTTSAALGSFEGRASGQVVLPAARALPPNPPTVSSPRVAR